MSLCWSGTGRMSQGNDRSIPKPGRNTHSIEAKKDESCEREKKELSMVSQKQETTPGDIDRIEFSKNLSLARHLHNLVSEHPDFEVFHEPAVGLYCFRYVPNAMAERQEEPGVQSRLNRLNQEIVDAVPRSGLALV